jgi:predicted nucleic-acid-binding Zn-ribbon protein
MKVSPCPNCGGTTLYRSKAVSAGGGYAPNYLPGLGSLFGAEKFNVVVCRGCGLARFFARPKALEKLSETSNWQRV